MISKVPLSGGGLILPLSFPQALSREFRPLERRPSRISTDRPQMESRPYEFLLHHHRSRIVVRGTLTLRLGRTGLYLLSSATS